VPGMGLDGLTFLVGIELLAIGEYLAKAYLETKRRPKSSPIS
jgi:hypothetical protein